MNRTMLIAIVIGAGCWALDARAASAPSESAWVFNLLPRTLQQNPRLDLTVVTELTPEGRKRPDVSVRHPAYCLIQSGGYHHAAGEAARGGSLPADAIDALVRQTLAARGYFLAAESVPASLVLVYNWGMHGRQIHDESMGGEEMLGDFLDRAGLVGGARFRAEVETVLAEAMAQADAAATAPTRHMELDGMAVSPVLGPEQMEFISPINHFRERSAKHDFLLEKAAGDVCFVIISAYDHDALAKGHRLLLWRTRLTVRTDGVAQAAALAALLGAAAPYLGRDMAEPAILTRRLHPEGQVWLGPFIYPDEIPGPAAGGREGNATD